MSAEMKVRAPSPLQRSILILLAGLAQRGTDRVRTRDLERLLERGGDRPVYGNNLRGSCRRMESAGWLRTLRADNLQLVVELTDAGQALALPLLREEQARVRAGQRATQVVVLPLVPSSPAPADGTLPADRPVLLDSVWHLACRGDYVVRLDGTTCLQLWNTVGQLTRLAGDPLQVASWLQACHDAGIAVRMQINESATPEEGARNLAAPADQTGTWYCQLDTALQALGISGLTGAMRQAVVSPEDGIRSLPAPARLLHVLRDSAEAFPLTADGDEDDTAAALADLLARAGFTGDQAEELRLHRIRWPLRSQEDADRRELNTLLDELEQRQLYCNRDPLTALVFSPVRKPGERWTERLQWLLSTGGFGLYSPLPREHADRLLNYLAGYVGQDAAGQLAAHVTWGVNEPPEKA